MTQRNMAPRIPDFMLIPYYRARYYSPQIGRFLSRDLLGSPLMMENPTSIFAKLDFIRNLSDAVSQITGATEVILPSLEWLSHNPLLNIDLSQGPNLYQYVQSNPADVTDPSGLAGGGRGSGGSNPSVTCPCGTHFGVYWSEEAANKMLDVYSGGFWGAGATTIGGRAIASGGEYATAAGDAGTAAAAGTFGSILSWAGVAAFLNAALDGLQEGCIGDGVDEYD